MNKCPGENTIVSYLQGTLKEREVMDEHLDTCEVCALLMMELGALEDLSLDTRNDAHARGMLTRTGAESPRAQDHTRSIALAGTFRDRYKLIDVLGRGGMGTVFEALDTQLNRHVALKVLHSTVEDEDERLLRSKRLLREARALAQLSHPNVLTVFEVGQHHDAVYVVTELIKGRSLDRYLQDQTLTPDELLSLFKAIAQGLAHAHEHGIIHRDFKPSNVMMTLDGNPVLIDFGLAARAHQHNPHTHLTQAGTIMGTPAYMSPEQHMGKPATAASDVFSWCVSLFEALFGERPFVGESAQEVAMRAYAGEIVTLTTEGAISESLMRLIKRGLSAEPEARPSNAQVLLEQLDHLDSRKVRTSYSPSKVVGVVALSLFGVLGVVLIYQHTTKQSIRPDVKPLTRHVKDKPDPQNVVVLKNKAPKIAPTPNNTPPNMEVKRLSKTPTTSPKGSTAYHSSLSRPKKKRSTTAPKATRVDRDGNLAKASTPSKVARSDVQPDWSVVGPALSKAQSMAQLHKIQACVDAIKHLPKDNLSVKLARGQCLMIQGKCDEGERLIQAYFNAGVNPSLGKKQAQTLRKQLCRPPASRSFERLVWELKPYANSSFLPKKLNCIKESRRVYGLLRMVNLDGYNKKQKQELISLVSLGMSCLKKQKSPTSCDVTIPLVRIESALRFPTKDPQWIEKNVRRSLKHSFPACKTP